MFSMQHESCAINNETYLAPILHVGGSLKTVCVSQLKTKAVPIDVGTAGEDRAIGWQTKVGNSCEVKRRGEKRG